MGIGAGLATAPLAQTMIAAFASARAGVASGINDTSRQLGGALGIAVIGSVTASIYAARIGELAEQIGLDRQLTRRLEQSVGGALDTAGATSGGLGREIGLAAKHAFADGFRGGMTAAAIVLAAAAIVAFCTLPGRTTLGETASTARQTDSTVRLNPASRMSSARATKRG